MIGGVNSVTNNGTLIVNNATNETLAGAMVGSGLLVQQGIGKLTLSGNNSLFTGPVSITNQLQVGNKFSGSLGSGPVTNNGTLIFAVAGSASVPVNISGSGGVSNINGTVTLGGTNSYAGTTVVDGGALLVGKTVSIPSTTLIGIDNNNNGAGSVGTFDLNGNDINIGGITGTNIGDRTAALVQGVIRNNGTTTNLITITGGTNTTYAFFKDNDNNGNITGPAHGALGIQLLGGAQMTLVAPLRDANTVLNSSVFGGGTNGPGIIVSNSTLILLGSYINSSSPNNEGTAAVGGNPAGTQNITLTGTNSGFYVAAALGNNGATVSTTVGFITVTTNTTAWIYGAQRGTLQATALVGSGNVIFQPRFVREQVNLPATNFTGTITFEDYIDTSGANLPLNSAEGFPKADVILGINNFSTIDFCGTVGGNVLPFGSLSGGDNSFIIDGGTNPTSEGSANTIYAIGGLNRTNTVGAQFRDGGVGIRKVGTGMLTLTTTFSPTADRPWSATAYWPSRPWVITGRSSERWVSIL